MARATAPGVLPAGGSGHKVTLSKFLKIASGHLKTTKRFRFGTTIIWGGGWPGRCVSEPPEQPGETMVPACGIDLAVTCPRVSGSGRAVD